MNINSIKQEKINDVTYVGIVYAKDWWNGIDGYKPVVQPFDFVVCQWSDFHDGEKSNIEGMTTLGIFHDNNDAQLFYYSKLSQFAYRKAINSIDKMLKKDK
jgi:hypothetical protein